MTFEQLRSRLTVWKRRLRLDNWLIVLELGGVSDEFAYMEVSRSPLYQRAVIHCQPWLFGGEVPSEVLVRGAHLTDLFLEESLVHELLHLYTRDMAVIVQDDLYGLMHRDAHTITCDVFKRAEEQCVDKLSVALVAAFGSTST